MATARIHGLPTAQASSAWLGPAGREVAPTPSEGASGADIRGGARMLWVGRFAKRRHPAEVHADLVADRSDLVVVDARWSESYAAEHIPGAINLFVRSIDAQTTAHLRRDAEYVVYCWNESCSASTKAAERLEALGFTAHELHGGLQKWKSEGFATERSTRPRS